MPSEAHESRVTLLDALGRLAGFSVVVAGGLPDGGRPDVLRTDPGCGSLFIGEAKDTETPDVSATQDRLSNYLRFFAAIVRRGLRPPILALCVGRDALAWRDLLWRIAIGLDLELSFELTPVPDAVVIWARVTNTPLTTTPRPSR